MLLIIEKFRQAAMQVWPSTGISTSNRRDSSALTVGCPGGESRAQIIEFASSQPANARVIACALGLNYKTVRRHLKILSENGMVVAIFEGTYGPIFPVAADGKSLRAVCQVAYPQS